MNAKQTLLKLAQKSHSRRVRAQELVQAWKERRGQPAPEAAGDLPLQAEIRELCTWSEYAGFWEIPYATFSDYSGTFIERSNSEVLTQKFPGLVVTLTGGHGTVMTGIPHDHLRYVSSNEAEELLEVLRALYDYPVVDEDHSVQLEHEAKLEAWENSGRDELRKRLIAEYKDKPMAALGAIYASDDDWDEWFREGGMYEYLQVEEGGSIYFGIEKAANTITEYDLEGIAESLPQVRLAPFRAFQRDLPEILKEVQAVVGPELVERLERLSDERLYALFEGIVKNLDEPLWDFDAQIQDDLKDHFTLRREAVREIALELADEGDTWIKRMQPESPGQLRLPLAAESATGTFQVVREKAARRGRMAAALVERLMSFDKI